jgi:hypothetical protein
MKLRRERGIEVEVRRVEGTLVAISPGKRNGVLFAPRLPNNCEGGGQNGNVKGANWPTGRLDKWPAAAVSASPFLSSLTSLSLSYLIFPSVVFSLSLYCLLFRVPFLLITWTVSVFGVGPQSHVAEGGLNDGCSLSMACEGESGPGPFKKGLRVNQTVSGRSQRMQRAGRCARYRTRELGGGPFYSMYCVLWQEVQ